MKIGMDEIKSGIEHAAIQKITKMLVNEGYTVKTSYLSSASVGYRFDLFAEKGDEKRTYVLKIGKNKIQSKQFEALQKEAKRLGSKLFIVYLEIPHSTEVDYEDLDIIICSDLSDNFPSEIDRLSTHTYIESVNDIEIDSINISDGIARLTGSGTIVLRLQFGSNTDFRNDDGVVECSTADFFFKVSIDISSNKIIKRYYKFDIEE